MAPRKNWTGEQLGSAISFISSGMSLSAASRAFGIPVSTLADKCRNGPRGKKGRLLGNHGFKRKSGKLGVGRTLKKLSKPLTAFERRYLTQSILAALGHVRKREPAESPIRMDANVHCEVLALERLDDLAKKFRGKYNLTLTVSTNATKFIQSKEISNKLDKWENEISRICLVDPVIAVENLVDNEGPPDVFNYVRENIYRDITLDPDFLVGCDCFPRCSQSCTCPVNGGGEFAYDRRKTILLNPGKPVYECNERCRCSSDCSNRVIQKGLTTSVCIFRTANGRGWGLKSREFISKNKFVVEYVGEVITSEEAEKRGKSYDRNQQTYLFDLDFQDKDAMYTIDAYKYGNVAHFINHSCDPNLQVYSVWVDTLDPCLPRIALFAKRDIYRGEELTFDYMASNDGFSTNQSVSRTYCACGSAKCRKYLF